MVYAGMAGGIMVLCWAAFGGFFKELFTGASDLVFWVEAPRNAARSGADSGQSAEAQDALRSGHRHWNAVVLFCTLRIWS